MTKTASITLLLLISFLGSLAQVSDNFSDLNFTQNPAWSGDDSLFQVSAAQLRLKGSVTAEAYLSTPFNGMDSVEWRFFTRINLNPSAQNYSRFYLVSDKANLKDSVNGYFVQFGGSTGNTDTIALYKQTGLKTEKILAARPATCGKTNNLIGVKVFRNHQGQWQLFTDTTGGNNFYFEGSVLDTAHTTNAYVGWYIRYTSSNAQNHYLDDVNIARIFADTSGPRLDSLVLLDSVSLRLVFNEPLNLPAALNTTNFWVDGNAINQVSSISPNSLLLSFATPFINKKQQVLTIKNLTDTLNNVTPDTNVLFLFYQPVLYDILMTEFLPDPSPSYGLPEHEFIELYNAAGLPINLQGYTFTDGKSTAVLPSYILMPNAFVLICDDADTAFFNEYGKAIGLPSFPSLNNDADSLLIVAANGNTMHAINYNTSWYGNATKANGGYSIELQMPRQLCKGKKVFSASNHPQGGTPGSVNSVWDTLPDLQSPSLIKTTNLNATQIAFKVSEDVDTLSFALTNIKLTPNWDVNQLNFVSTDSFLITARDSLLNKTNYQITINGLTDCAQNKQTQTVNLTTAYAEQEQFCDVVINEIMCNPVGANNLPEFEYIEIYNRSNRIIDLENWQLADGTSKAKLPKQLLYPDSFIVYYPAVAKLPGSITGFPILGNETDVITLTNQQGQVVHHIAYNTSNYNQPIKQQGGWSLELIDPNNPCDAFGFNYSTDTKGGSPGFKNAIFYIQPDTSTTKIISANLRDSLSLEVIFNKTIDSSSINLLNVLVDDVAAYHANWIAPAYNQINLGLALPLVPNKEYELTVLNAKGCVSKPANTNYSFPYAVWPEKNDLIINEVLFNPKTNGYDFVELHNLTNKYIKLDKLFLANLNQQQLPDEISIIGNAAVLYPNSFVVITPNAKALAEQYFCKFREHIIEANLPSMPDDEGSIILANSAVVFDVLTYNQNMHFALLDEQEGISLERINPLAPTQQTNNWTSAAATVGYATPTYTNSQKQAESNQATGLLSIVPQRCSPDGDGFEDVLPIRYNVPNIGYTASISIYNDAGVLIAKPMANQLIPKTGEIYWDGITLDGTKAPIGIYVAYLEAFDLTGNTINAKAGFAVVTK